MVRRNVHLSQPREVHQAEAALGIEEPDARELGEPRGHPAVDPAAQWWHGAGLAHAIAHD